MQWVGEGSENYKRQDKPHIGCDEADVEIDAQRESYGVDHGNFKAMPGSSGLSLRVLENNCRFPWG